MHGALALSGSAGCMLPERPGTYVLVLKLPSPATIMAGRLGRLEFPLGWYAYVGSARGSGGLAARLRRHLRSPKPLRWHVDYLRAESQPGEVWYAVGAARRECAWYAALTAFPGASVPIPGFGASDCRCEAHLVHFAGAPDAAAFACAVGEPISLWRPMPDAYQAFRDAIAAGDDAVTEQAAMALRDLGDAAVPLLHDTLSDQDPNQRWWASRALAAVGGLAAREPLAAALADSEPSVRACAAQGLGELGAEEATAALVAHLADSDALVSRIAADSLARIGAPAAPALVAALQSGNAPTRAGAARALSLIRCEDAVPALCAALDDSNPIVSYYAEHALEQTGVGWVFVVP